MNTGTGNPQTPRNPTITALFATKNGSGNFTSPPIDAEAFKVIQTQLSLGNVLFLKKSKKQDKNGNDYFFLEVMPPYDNANEGRGTRKPTGRTRNQEDSV